MSDETHHDSLILGVGISGIDAAYYLLPHSGEEREPGGDFFKHPGIGSDSDEKKI